MSQGGQLSAARPWVGWSGRVSLEPTAGTGLPVEWAEAGLTVRYRAEGQRLGPGDSVKRRLQAAGVVPWMRPYVPLLFRGEDLIAVADLWLSQETADSAAQGSARYAVVWRCPRPVF